MSTLTLQLSQATITALNQARREAGFATVSEYLVHVATVNAAQYKRKAVMVPMVDLSDDQLMKPEDMNVSQLKDWLKARDLPHAGSKAELIQEANKSLYGYGGDVPDSDQDDSQEPPE